MPTRRPPIRRDSREVMIEAMIESALRSAQLAEEVGLAHDRIILSAKVSGVQDLVEVYARLADRCDYPLHLGLTEAGMGAKGIITSTAGLAILLQRGIGDTIRVSLTPEPGGDRTQEVQVAQQVLQSLGLRSFLPQVSACPGCGRTTSTFFQEMARDIQAYLVEQMPKWRETHPGVEEMRVAVMGCVVNGPGESKHADIGISLPGTFEEPVAPVFVDGAKTETLRGDDIVPRFLAILDDYVERRYGARTSSRRRARKVQAAMAKATMTKAASASGRKATPIGWLTWGGRRLAPVRPARPRRARHRVGWREGSSPCSLLVHDGCQLLLQRACRDLADLARHDRPVAADEVGLGWRNDAIRGGHALVGIHRRGPGRTVALHERAGRLGPVLVDDPDDLEAVRGVPLVRLAKQRELLDAGAAPGGPEVDDHRAASEVGQPNRVAVKVGQDEVRCDAPDRGRRGSGRLARGARPRAARGG